MDLDAAVELTRTGDLWLFRGRSGADRAIQTLTNAPVNHVGMAVVLDDLPPLMWHAELGRRCRTCGPASTSAGCSCTTCATRCCSGDAGTASGAGCASCRTGRTVTPEMEDALLGTIARLDGTPFPSTARLAGRWLRGRLPARAAADPGADDEARWRRAYCAEVVAVTYEEMGLLPGAPRARTGTTPAGSGAVTASRLREGYRLGGEIAVALPPD